MAAPQEPAGSARSAPAEELHPGSGVHGGSPHVPVEWKNALFTSNREVSVELDEMDAQLGKCLSESLIFQSVEGGLNETILPIVIHNCSSKLFRGVR